MPQRRMCGELLHLHSITTYVAGTGPQARQSESPDTASAHRSVVIGSSTVARHGVS